MAPPRAFSTVSAEDYLNSSYSPDLEYVDGVLVERSAPTIAHSVLQMFLIQYFGQFQKTYGFLSLPEVRTQIIARARYRIPDGMLCPVPLPAGKVITTIPWVVFEILSPEDRMQEQQLERFRDYSFIGVDRIILLDPERLVAHRFEDGSLLKTQFTELLLPSGAIPFDTDALFRQVEEHQQSTDPTRDRLSSPPE